MKVAITGAGGHLGAAIVQELFKRGISIKALLRKDNFPFAGIPANIVKGDLFDKDALESLMKDCDTLIHCAAVISLNGDPGGIVHKTNVEGTESIFNAAKKTGIRRVIHISTIHTFRQLPANEELTEQREKVGEKAVHYDRSKKEGEEIALAMNGNGLEVLVMNPTGIIGPYDFKPSRVGKTIIDLTTGRLPFIFDGGFDFCDSRDVANAVANALTLGRPGENYILSGNWHNLKELAALLAKASGKKVRAYTIPYFAGKMGLPFVHAFASLTKKEPFYTIEAMDTLITGNKKISNAKAVKELNYTARSFEETITDTFQWFQQNGYLS